MTVLELIDQLSDLPPNTEVLCSSDGEGNEFRRLDDIAKTHVEFIGCEVFTGPAELTPELEADGYTDEDILENGKPAIILFPG